MAEVWSHSGVWILESGVTPESGVRSLESLRSLVAEVWSHSGEWSMESGVTPEFGVWSYSGV